LTGASSVFQLDFVAGFVINSQRIEVDKDLIIAKQTSGKSPIPNRRVESFWQSRFTESSRIDECRVVLSGHQLTQPTAMSTQPAKLLGWA